MWKGPWPVATVEALAARCSPSAAVIGWRSSTNGHRALRIPSTTPVDGGKPPTVTPRWTEVYVDEAGAWLLAAVRGGPDSPDNLVASEHRPDD
jgi:hypothetical protein